MFVTKDFKIEMVINVHSGVIFVGEIIVKRKGIGVHALTGNKPVRSKNCFIESQEAKER